MARRIFLLFVLCGLVPLAALSYLSFVSVTAQLHADATERLRSASKSLGMALFERLLLLDARLQTLASALASEHLELDSPASRALAEKLGDRFLSLALTVPSGETFQVLGSAPPLADIDVPEREHLDSGKSLLRIARDPSGRPRITLARLASVGRRAPGILHAEVDPRHLWAPAEAGYMTDVVVLDHRQRLLFATNPGQLPLEELQHAQLASDVRGSFEWKPHGEPHTAGYWSLFLAPSFAAPSWTVVHSQANAAILLPLEDFEATFPMVVLLSFLVVVFLSLTQIRRHLVPIELLRAAALRIADKDFGARVRIESKDEFRDLGRTFNHMAESIEAHLSNMRTVSEVGMALSAERDSSRLMDRILRSAMRVVRADAGALYLVNPQGRLVLSSLRVDSIGLEDRAAEAFAHWPSGRAAASRTAQSAPSPLVSDRTINVLDVYACDDFDFSDYRRFDEHAGYRCRSFLSVPMKNHEEELIGVLQLVNTYDGTSANVVPVSKDAQRVAESLASQAAVALTKNRLVDEFKMLFEGLIDLLVTAVDEKSPYTGGHCRRVPILTNMLADAVSRTASGPFREFDFTREERYELNIAALLHDCGKVTTPVHVVDKATKLETIFDRIHVVDTRFEVLKRDARIRCLLQQIDALEQKDSDAYWQASVACEEELRRIDGDRNFLRSCNVGSESMGESLRERVRRVAASYRWVPPEGGEAPCLSDDEVYNLTIPKGTLTPEEREVVDYHAVATIKMLGALQYPRHLRRVPGIAGSHHERIDGSGYPNRLRKDEISIQGRILGIADVFEALTAADRPYKEKTTMGEALRMLARMKKDGQIDADLFDVFVSEKVYLQYARECLDPEQLDDVLL